MSWCHIINSMCSFFGKHFFYNSSCFDAIINIRVDYCQWFDTQPYRNNSMYTKAKGQLLLYAISNIIYHLDLSASLPILMVLENFNNINKGSSLGLFHIQTIRNNHWLMGLMTINHEQLSIFCLSMDIPYSYLFVNP